MKLRSSVIALLGITPLLLVLLAPQTLSAARKSPIARAAVWQATDIPSMDIMAGPTGPGAFPFKAEVECTYLDKKLSGKSPKFACMRGKDDELKVKYGGTNGEVYAEMAATRLLWALGFGADHMYSVEVICHGCPAELGGILRENGDRLFAPATIERKIPAAVIEDKFSWTALDEVDEEAGGAPRAQRDALKLMAAFIQHTDTKSQQQRVVCLGADKLPPDDSCQTPLIMIQDAGVTFGRASRFNDNSDSSMNLMGWSRTPVWKSQTGPCVSNLPKSFTGTLDDPRISEAGRRFLAGLLQQLSDAQIHALFEVSRVSLRLREPDHARSGFPTVDEWVDAFKQKRDEIVNRRCA